MLGLLTGTWITLPASFVTDLQAYVGGLFTDLSTLIVIAIALPVGFWVIRKAISLVRAR